MIKRIIKGIVLAVFFAGALLISNYVMNRGTDDKIMTMGEPTLPVVSFTVSGQEINLLSGYVDQMDVTAMRDTITPLESNGTLQAEIAENGNKISKISYKVYSLDGADTYAEGKVKEEDGKVTLELGTALDQSAQEAVLKLTLTLGSGEAQKKVNYFTRIEKPDEITAWKCLTFAKDFHAKALDQSDEDTLSMYLEPGEESDNTTYQTVNIHSDITHIQWGDLNPEIVGDVQWSLKESNSVYTSILAKYQVRCQDDKEETARYNVKEFFRIRSVGDTIYLLDYNRDLQEVFSSRSVMDQKGILLGIVPEDVPYETNKQDSILAFVQNRTLWMYNKKNEELTKVFSFAEEDTQDVRSLNDQHAVRIISMDDHGNIAFAVYGYMNRGEHEGEVGVGIYYFNVDSNLIQEKGFIPSTKSFAIAEDELGKMVYYNHAQELLYVLADQVLYRIDLDKNQQEVLAKGLEAGKYAVSDDGHQLAYQTDGEKDAAKEIRVMDLSSGDEYSVKAAKNEAQKGFFEKREALSARISDLDKELLRLQNQSDKLAERQDAQVEYMWNEYGLKFSTAELLRDGSLDNVADMKRQIAERKNAIRGLGNVNVNAIEDYKEISERYEFMKTQHDDLITAQDALYKIIEELDIGMRKQFTEKFAMIRAEFDKVFRELFGGGHGSLELIEDEDILEAGIQIISQPPGKKLQNMMQMSGGEKALTAIALLFAIQNLKPSPFCLLDEIEAALDDSNVDRFANYLHKLTKNTQFIVITHRRGTMMAADRLYGITMQEKGVSTLVSVNLIEDSLTK